MGWFGFQGQGRSPQRRSYHARGGVSRARAGAGDVEPMTVEDVVRSASFWKQNRGQVTAFLLMGFGGFLFFMIVAFPGGQFRLSGIATAIGAVTLLLLVAPLLFWIRYRQQQREYERVADRSDPHERID